MKPRNPLCDECQKQEVASGGYLFNHAHLGGGLSIEIAQINGDPSIIKDYEQGVCGKECLMRKLNTLVDTITPMKEAA